jgi:hypothetical protein
MGDSGTTYYKYDVCIFKEVMKDIASNFFNQMNNLITQMELDDEYSSVGPYEFEKGIYKRLIKRSDISEPYYK